MPISTSMLAMPISASKMSTFLAEPRQGEAKFRLKFDLPTPPFAARNRNDARRAAFAR